MAAIRYLKGRGERFLGGVEAMGAHLRARLARIDFEGRAEVRGKGLAIAVELGDEDYAERVAERCRRKGLLLTTQRSALLLLPALDVSRTIADRALDILAARA